MAAIERSYRVAANEYGIPHGSCIHGYSAGRSTNSEKTRRLTRELAVSIGTTVLLGRAEPGKIPRRIIAPGHRVLEVCLGDHPSGRRVRCR